MTATYSAWRAPQRRALLPTGMCAEQQANLGAAWFFAICWLLVISAWLYAIARLNAGRNRRRWLLLSLGIVPFFHIGDQAVQIFTHTFCTCGVCTFGSLPALRSYIIAFYVFSVGRWCALLLCLFLIATGAGTVRPRLLGRNWAAGGLLFTGFPATIALSLPVTAWTAGIDPQPPFVASIALYVAIFLTIFVEADVQSRVLKAQLLMIRGEGIAPRSTPAWAKLQLFLRIRRYVLLYFVVHAATIIITLNPLALWQSMTILIIWELAQLSITATIGYLFSGTAASSATNPYLDREAHMDAAAVRRRIAPDEVSLLWRDIDGVTVAEDAGSATAEQSLRPWQESIAVPPPPEPPRIVTVFGVSSSRRGRRGRRVANQLDRGTATSSTAQAQISNPASLALDSTVRTGGEEPGVELHPA
jgi:hypothetical protein